MHDSAFVILAAGRGTRVGRVGVSLHKALLPLNQRAIITRLIDLAPDDADVIICLGHRGDQIKEFIRLAHPNLKVTFIDVHGWDESGGGPGLSLLAAHDAVGYQDMLFTSCDTLWNETDLDSQPAGSWAGVAPVPAGTQPARWCRIITAGDRALSVLDKVPDGPTGVAYTGLGRIIKEDLEAFWGGVLAGTPLAGEHQVTGGLEALASTNHLNVHRIHWTDVGDAAAYSHAVTATSGYDWTKADEATYVMPDQGRVVKFWDDVAVGNRSAERADYIGDAVPTLVDRGRQMLAYKYVPGTTMYEALKAAPIEYPFTRLYQWAAHNMWLPVDDARDVEIAAYNFYRNKTLERVEMLRAELFVQASDAVARVNWDELVKGVVPCRFHGDLNAGNVIVSEDGEFVGIDWRGDFAGNRWGDRRYDEAKLLAGCVIHWDRARRGDFRPWEDGDRYFAEVLECVPEKRRRDVQTIGALSLLNSAPLHVQPLDDVLVVRGVRWLETLA